jgi:tRNA A-37 threonylcarbamoyl transferase component Bud32
MIDRVVGNYRMVERLGEGAMGAVYKGVDLMVEREVAIKMLRPEIARQPEIVARFHAEGVTLAKLNHPNIATLYSFFREGDEFFMVMEFVVGRTLDAVIREEGAMVPERAVGVASQVLNAVEHAHGLGILHRDLKPANIMLTSSMVKVTDFGIARALGQARMTREGNLVGTLEYLAPERIRGQEADGRSDLYSVGVVLYEMLSGRLPFERDTEFELMRAQLEESPPAFSSLGLTGVPAQLEETVFRALAKVPEERFGTAGEFRRALEPARRPMPVKSTRLAVKPVLGTKATRLAVEAPAVSGKAPRVPTQSGAFLRGPRWLYYGGAVALAVGLMLTIALVRGGRHASVDANKPAPPGATQPSPAASQPAATGVGGAPPTLPTDFGRTPTVKDLFPAAPSAGVTVGAKPSAGTSRRAGKVIPAAERRKAALKALDEGGPTVPDANKKKKPDAKKSDRRTESLDALQK